MNEYNINNNKSIGELVNDFIKDERINSLLSPTIFEIYANYSSELAHTSFFAVLFDSNKNGGYGNAPLKKFIKLIEEKMPGTFDKNIPRSNIVFENYELSNIETIKNAHRLLNKKNQFIDLIIEFSYYSKITNKLVKFSIIVENKIKSNEHDDQTVSYYEVLEEERINNEKKLNENVKYENVYIYLTPSRRGKKPACKNFIWITYADLFKYVIEPLSSSVYEHTHLYNTLLDYKKLLLRMKIIDFEGKRPNQELINSIKTDYNKLFKEDQNISSNDKELLDEFKNIYKELFHLLNIKNSSDYYDFNDLGLNNGDRLYFSKVKTTKDAKTNIEENKISKKYEIYPDGSKGLILYKENSDLPQHFDSVTQLGEFLYQEEGMTQSVANAKDNIYFKVGDTFYSLTQLRKKQLEEEL